MKTGLLTGLRGVVSNKGVRLTGRQIASAITVVGFALSLQACSDGDTSADAGTDQKVDHPIDTGGKATGGAADAGSGTGGVTGTGGKMDAGSDATDGSADAGTGGMIVVVGTGGM